TTSIRSKKNKNLPIVEDISFSVGTGEIVGIVGESGCGKSMTALSVIQLLPKNIKVDKESSISFDETDITELSTKNMRSIRGNDISMIFQEPMTSLNPVLKIGKQIREIVSLHQPGIDVKSKTLELLER